MFEQAEARAQAISRARADEAAAEIVRRAEAAGVRAEPVPEGVRLSGRRLKLRFVTDPALRTLLP